jgi:hypothetical protein
VKAQVEITSESPVIEVERTQQANTIDKRQVENLPNVGRTSRAMFTPCRVFLTRTRLGRSLRVALRASEFRLLDRGQQRAE